MYACIIWTITLSASAHEDAQGVVKERMDSMNQMSNAMKVISEFARANRMFESAQIIEQIGILKNHSGSKFDSTVSYGNYVVPFKKYVKRYGQTGMNLKNWLKN